MKKFQVNYDKWFKKEKYILKKDLIFLACGLEPKHANSFLSILEKEEVIKDNNLKRKIALYKTNRLNGKKLLLTSSQTRSSIN